MMFSRIWRIYRAESAKAIRSRGCWTGPLLVAAAALAPIVYQAARDPDASGYAMIAVATPFALNTVGFLAILVFNASLVASESSAGTLRQALVRPILRHEFVLGKLLFGLSYALLLLVLAAAASWAGAALTRELHGVIFGGELLFSQGEMMLAYLLGAALAVPPLAAGAALALMVSVCVRGSGAAVAIILGAWVLADAVKYPLGIDYYVFTTYLDAPWEVFAARCDGIAVEWRTLAGRSAVVCGITFAISTAVAALVLQRRNLG